VAAGVESGVEVQDHDLEGKGENPLPHEHDLKQDETVHPTGYGDTDTGTVKEHAGLLNQLSTLAQTSFLGVFQLSPLGHIASFRRPPDGRPGGREKMI
jgi:hypothetical protein